jgi:hypothetical protein
MKYNSLWTGSVSVNSPVSLEGNTSYHVVNWNCRRIRCRLLETSLSLHPMASQQCHHHACRATKRCYAYIVSSMTRSLTSTTHSGVCEHIAVLDQQKAVGRRRNGLGCGRCSWLRPLRSCASTLPIPSLLALTATTNRASSRRARLFADMPN